jgi:hypothetical protein
VGAGGWGEEEPLEADEPLEPSVCAGVVLLYETLQRKKLFSRLFLCDESRSNQRK